MASEQGHLEIVKILLQNHARVDVFDEVNVCIFCVTIHYTVLQEIKVPLLSIPFYRYGQQNEYIWIRSSIS